MNAKHRKILGALFGKPTPKTMVFRDIEYLLSGLGCTIIEGEGSRVSFFLNDEIWHTHRPHPGKEAYGFHIRDVKRFLMDAGVSDE